MWACLDQLQGVGGIAGTLGLQGALQQHHGVLALGFRRRQQLVLGGLPRAARSAPSRSPACWLRSNRLSSTQGVRGLQRVGRAHVLQGRLPVAVAQRLGDQAAQAEEAGLVALQHGGEVALGRLVVAVELGCLGRQQHGERRCVQQLARLARIALGLGRLAGGDSHHALGQRPVAALLAVGLERATDVPRRVLDAAPGAVEQRHHDRQQAGGQQQDADRGVDPVVEPLQRHLARLLLRQIPGDADQDRDFHREQDRP